MRIAVLFWLLLSIPAAATEIGTLTTVQWYGDTVLSEMRVIDPPDPAYSVEHRCRSLLEGITIDSFIAWPTTASHWIFKPGYLTMESARLIETGLVGEALQQHLHIRDGEGYCWVTQAPSLGPEHTVKVGWQSSSADVYAPEDIQYLQWECVYRDDAFNLIGADQAIRAFYHNSNVTQEATSFLLDLPPKPPGAKYVQVWLTEESWIHHGTIVIPIGTYGMTVLELP